jgi:N-acetylglucosamine-6-sulfatase
MLRNTYTSASRARLLMVLVTGIVSGIIYTANPSTRFGAGAAVSPVFQDIMGPLNIIVIMTDDQDFRSIRVMKNVKELLVDSGTRFQDSFVSFPLCCPSRASFLTGQYAHNHGVMDNRPPTGGYGMLDHTNTLAVWLQQAGYHTAHIGKYLNGYGTQVPRETIPSGWTEWYGAPDPGAYSFYNFQLNENGTLVFYGDGEENYQTDVYTRKAVDFIQRMATTDAPFFLSVAFLAPHDDIDPSLGGPEPAPRHKGFFKNTPLPRLPSFNEEDLSDKPFIIRSRSPMTSIEIEDLTVRYHRRLESLLAVDEAVKMIIDAIEAAGKLHNTAVIFTSDNGFLQGEHRIPKGKVYLYEESIRVPLIIRHPALIGNKVRTELVANIDLAPTIVELANAVPNRVMDGRSLWPLMNGTSAGWRSHLLIESPSQPLPFIKNYSAVRTKQYIYAEYITGEKEFYNFLDDSCHSADPYQLESQHSNPCYSQIIDELSQRLSILRACTGDSCW